MKKFTIDQYKEAKATAKEFNINPIGKAKQLLVDLVNQAIEAKAAAEAKQNEKAPTKTLADYNLEEGQMVTISGRQLKDSNKAILVGRRMVVSKASKVDGYINGYLINDKTNKLQKTDIAIPVNCIIQGQTIIAVEA